MDLLDGTERDDFLISEGGASWRPYSLNAWWTQYDAAVGSDGGRTPSWDIYTYGELVATRPSYTEAQAYLEAIYGPLPWRRVTLPRIKVEHPSLGLTDAFSVPGVIWVVDLLPRLGVAHA
jgi:hypothetical protein